MADNDLNKASCITSCEMWITGYLLYRRAL